MRGVVSLAAAIALPQTLAAGAPFSQRNMIIFFAFSVILVTLVLQGLTLPSLIRALGVAGTVGVSPEEREARRVILQTALDYLEQSQRDDDPASAEIYADLAQHYRHRLETLLDDGDGARDPANVRFYRRFNDLSRKLIRIERQTAVRLRNQRKIGDELLRNIEHELDLSETRLANNG
jgi:CPA1 family monovalent cation:H+ antiporter